jgi:GntR family transcriptional regulator
MNAATDPEVILQGGAPIARQIRDQIRACILAGRLQPGEQLPTLRQAAVSLAVNPRAVHRAYTRLEREGFLSSEDGSGVFVAPPRQVRRATQNRQARLDALCGRFLARAERQGFTTKEVAATLSQFAQGEIHHGRED